MVQLIGGLDTNIRYKIIKLTDDEFRLANAGAAGTITANYDRNNYVNIVSVGTSEQFFAYPPINVTVNADISWWCWGNYCNSCNKRIK